MGNSLSAGPPVTPDDVRTYLAEIVHVVGVEVIGDSKFLKTAVGRGEDGKVVAKLKKLPGCDYRLLHQRLKQMQATFGNGASHHQNILPYMQFAQSKDRSVAVLVRPHVMASLYDRLSTRPFLSHMEKLWLVYQLLCALKQAHGEGICHGDVKAENVLVTSWNWLFLVDFACYKPAYLPEDDHADFYYYFDNGTRSRCYVAPERFSSLPPQDWERVALQHAVAPTLATANASAAAAAAAAAARRPAADAMDGSSTEQALSELLHARVDMDYVDSKMEGRTSTLKTGLAAEEANQPGLIVRSSLQPSMDIFSAGCVIAELFLEGNVLFELEHVLGYRIGTYYPDMEIAKLPLDIQPLVRHMVDLNPLYRDSAEGYLNRFSGPGALFPPFFQSVLMPIMTAMLQPNHSSPDARIKIVVTHYRNILANICGVRDPFGEAFCDRVLALDDDTDDTVARAQQLHSVLLQAAGPLDTAAPGELYQPWTPLALLPRDTSVAETKTATVETSDTRATDAVSPADPRPLTRGARSTLDLLDYSLDTLMSATQELIAELTADASAAPHGDTPAHGAPTPSGEVPAAGATPPSTEVPIGAISTSGLEIIIDLLCCFVRAAQYPRWKVATLVITTRLAMLCDDDTRLQRLVPYLVSLLSDPAAVVRANALYALTAVLEQVHNFPATDNPLFQLYILPTIFGRLTTDLDPIMQLAFADCLPRIAQCSRRFLDLAQLAAQRERVQAGASTAASTATNPVSAGGAAGTGVAASAPPAGVGAADSEVSSLSAGWVPASADADVDSIATPAVVPDPEGFKDPEDAVPSTSVSNISMSEADGESAVVLNSDTEAPASSRVLVSGSYDSDLLVLHDRFRAALHKWVAVLSEGARRQTASEADSVVLHSLVKTRLLASLPLLCSFFGRELTEDFLMPLVFTFLNSKSWQLKIALMRQLVAVGAFVGHVSFDKFLLPFFTQPLADPMEPVGYEGLRCLVSTINMGLMMSNRITDCAKDHAVPLLVHPGPWLRQGAILYIMSAVRALGFPESEISIAPLLTPVLRRRLRMWPRPGNSESEQQFRAELEDALLRPLSRRGFEAAISALVSNMCTPEALHVAEPVIAVAMEEEFDDPQDEGTWGWEDVAALGTPSHAWIATLSAGAAPLLERGNQSFAHRRAAHKLRLLASLIKDVAHTRQGTTASRETASVMRPEAALPPVPPDARRLERQARRTMSDAANLADALMSRPSNRNRSTSMAQGTALTKSMERDLVTRLAAAQPHDTPATGTTPASSPSATRTLSLRRQPALHAAEFPFAPEALTGIPVNQLEIPSQHFASLYPAPASKAPWDAPQHVVADATHVHCEESGAIPLAESHLDSQCSHPPGCSQPTVTEANPRPNPAALCTAGDDPAGALRDMTRLHLQFGTWGSTWETEVVESADLVTPTGADTENMDQAFEGVFHGADSVTAKASSGPGLNAAGEFRRNLARAKEGMVEAEAAAGLAPAAAHAGPATGHDHTTADPARAVLGRAGSNIVDGSFVGLMQADMKRRMAEQLRQGPVTVAGAAAATTTTNPGQQQVLGVHVRALAHRISALQIPPLPPPLGHLQRPAKESGRKEPLVAVLAAAATQPTAGKTAAPGIVTTGPHFGDSDSSDGEGTGVPRSSSVGTDLSAAAPAPPSAPPGTPESKSVAEDPATVRFVLPADAGDGTGYTGGGWGGAVDAGADVTERPADRPAWWGSRPRGLLVATIHEHTGAVNQLAVPQDHTFIASASSDQTVRILPTAFLDRDVAPRSRLTFDAGAPVFAVTAIENSHSIAAGDANGVVNVLRVDIDSVPSRSSADTGQRLRSWSAAGTSRGSTPLRAGAMAAPAVVTKLVFPDEGAVVSVAHHNTVSQSLLLCATEHWRVHGWDLRARAQALRFQVPVEFGFTTTMAVVPDHSAIIVGTSRGCIATFDLRYQLLVSAWRHCSMSPIFDVTPFVTAGAPPQLAASVAAGDDEVSIWNLHSGRCLRVLRSVPTSMCQADALRAPFLRKISVVGDSVQLPPSATDPLSSYVNEFRSRSATDSAVRAVLCPLPKSGAMDSAAPPASGAASAAAAANRLPFALGGLRSLGESEEFVSSSAGSGWHDVPTWLVTAGGDRCIRCWDLKEAKRSHTIGGLEPGDDRHIYGECLALPWAASNPPQKQPHDLSSGRFVYSEEPDSLSVCKVPGRRLPRIALCQPEVNVTVHPAKGVNPAKDRKGLVPASTAHRDAVTCLAWVDQPSRLLISGCRDGSMKLWK